MTPKERAKKLIDNFKFVEIANYTSKFEVKQCALIAVDQVIDILYDLSDCGENIVEKRDFYEEVKQEIEKL